MPQDPEATKDQAPEPTPRATPPDDQQKEQDAGDFITRHVLEKDSVFFEG